MFHCNNSFFDTKFVYKTFANTKNSVIFSLLYFIRSREEKISSYDKEIKRIVKETEVEQCNSEFYDSQERHYRGELAKLEQANFPNPKAEVSIMKYNISNIILW